MIPLKKDTLKFLKRSIISHIGMCYSKIKVLNTLEVDTVELQELIREVDRTEDYLKEIDKIIKSDKPIIFRNDEN